MLLTKSAAPGTNIFWFTGFWISHTLFSMAFAVNGRNSSYYSAEPLPIIIILYWVAFVGGTAMLIFYGKKILWKNQLNRLLIAISGLYLAALWFNNYSDYRHFGWPVAIQGRYWIPILIPILVLLAQMLASVLKKHNNLKVILALALVILLLQGGGLATFILRSDETWYWQNSVVYKVNQKSRSVLSHVIIS
jgi:hypothetical protein